MTISRKFVNNGPVVSIANIDSEQVTEMLPAMVYSVGFDMDSGYFLNKVSNLLSLPERVYGDVNTRVERIMRSYKDSHKSFGVLLSGNKGSGKSLLTAIVANKAIAELNLPVILVENRFNPSSLCSFLDKIGECVILFDEFAKRWPDFKDQEQFLSFLDGTTSKKRLILITENQVGDVVDYILNRPGRVHYHFKYDKLDEKVVTELCKEHGLDDKTINKILIRRDMSEDFSFDILNALIKEFKMFGGDIDELAVDLNVPETYKIFQDKAEILSITDVDSGKTFEFIDQTVPFPKATKHAVIEICDAEGDDKPSFILLSVGDIVYKSGDVYKFLCKFRGAEILVKCRKISNTGVWHSYS